VGRLARLGAVALAIAVSAGLIAFYVVGYLMVRPPEVQAAGTPRHAQLTLQTVASLGFKPHPDWVSYLAKNQSGCGLNPREATVCRVSCACFGGPAA